jgi:GAF domain-containing protein
MQTLGMNSSDLPGLGSFSQERRRRPRHKIHTPAYARISGDSAGFLLDLNTIVDLSEEGMCIQTPAALNVNQVFHLCLELADAASPIYTEGRVIWSNRLGRTGILFGELSEGSSHQLKRWLFLNAISGVADSRSAAPNPDTPSDAATGTAPAATDLSVAGPTDYTTLLTALSAVRREAEMLGPDINAVLHLAADRALTFTHGSGAAIALSNGMEIVCRASAGTDAPGVGARVSTDSGLSALCVRNGELLISADSEKDIRVDGEVCRALGIRSIIAAPIFQENTVVGLIEVFSREPNSFGLEAKLVLKELVEAITASLDRTAYAQRHVARLITPEIPMDEGEFSPATSGLRSWFRRSLLALALLTVVAAMLWLFLPRNQSRAAASQQPSKSQSANPLQSSPPPVVLNDQRKLAEQGDAAVQYAIGARYAVGDGVKQDYSEAARWFSMAAAQGNVDAQATLAAYYLSGTGVAKDLSKAYFWAVLAQAGGDKASKYRIPNIASRMTHEQLVAVQDQANNWLKEHRAQNPAP